MIAGAYVAGQIHNAESFDQLFAAYPWVGWLLRPLRTRILAKRRAREMLYDQVDPFGGEMLGLEARNFQIARADIARIRFHYKRTMRSPNDVGVADLHLFDGTRRRLIVAGGYHADAVVRHLRELDPAIEVSGSAQYRSPHEHARFRPRDYVTVGIFFLVIAFGLLAIVVWTGLNDPRMNIVLGLCAGVSCLSFLNAWRTREA
jgi:hypothetical protein